MKIILNTLKNFKHEILKTNYELENCLLIDIDKSHEAKYTTK